MKVALSKQSVKNILFGVAKQIDSTPRRLSGDGLVLLFHGIDESGLRFTIAPDTFYRFVEIIKKNEITFVGAGDFGLRVKNQACLRDVCCLTFDDAIKSAFECIKHLALNNIRSTIFVIVERVEKGRDNTMSWKELVYLNDLGVEIGSHTLAHRNLTLLTESEIARELSESKAKLEDMFGSEVSSLAYPYGAFNRTVVQFAKDCGYKYGYTTQRAYASSKFNMLKLPRFEPETPGELRSLVKGESYLLYRLLGAYRRRQTSMRA